MIRHRRSVTQEIMLHFINMLKNGFPPSRENKCANSSAAKKPIPIVREPNTSSRGDKWSVMAYTTWR